MRTSFLKTLPLFATLMFSLLAGGGAQAQAGYTSQELVSTQAPDSYRACQPQFLGDNGDAAGVTEYVTGYSLKYTGTWEWTANTSFKLTVWRNGGQPGFLPLPLGYSLGFADLWGVDGRGRVLGTLTGLFGRTANWWDGTRRTTWSPVDGFASPGRWNWSRATASGKVAAYTHTPRARLAVLSGTSTVQDIPLPPEPGLAAGTVKFGDRSGSLARNAIAMNDKGQIAVTTEPVAMVGDRPPTQIWFWNGSAWTNITPPPSPYMSGIKGYSTTLRIVNVNASGQVSIADEGDVQRPDGGYSSAYYQYIWSPQSGLYKVPLETVVIGGSPIADNGDLVGMFPVNVPGFNAPQWRAALWRNGQAIDLNTLATPPAGEVYVSVIDVNAKGQLLVASNQTQGGGRTRHWLLTPR